MRSRFTCVFLLALVGIAYIVIIISYFHVNSKQKHPVRQDSHPMMLVVLISQPRSGSTFLSQIISNSFQSIYFYEPLYREDRKFGIDTDFATAHERERYDERASTFLRNIFSCNFKNRLEWLKLFKSPFKVLGKYSRDEKECDETILKLKFGTKNEKKFQEYMIKNCLPYLNSYHLQKQCMTQNLMVKLLESRIPHVDLVQLSSLVHAHVLHRIIYLIRDPRASFHSLLRTGWVTKTFDELFHKYVRKRCSEMYKNSKAIATMKNFIVVRYEDMITLPEKALQELTNFFDKEVVNKIFKELHNVQCYVPKLNNDNTTFFSPYGDGGNGHVATHKTYGKIDYKHRQNYECFAVNKWRYKCSGAFVKLVEDSCKPVMDIFGYKLAGGDITTIRNIKLPLVLPMAISSS